MLGFWVCVLYELYMWEQLWNAKKDFANARIFKNQGSWKYYDISSENNVKKTLL